MFASTTGPRQEPNADTHLVTALQPDIQFVIRDTAPEGRVLPVFFLLLLSIPFEWLRISWIGHRSVLIIPLMLVVLDIAKSPVSGLRRLQRFLQLAPWITGLYIAYMTSLTCAALLGPNLSTGMAELGRAWSLFGFYVVVGTYLTGQPATAIAKTLLSAIPLAMAGFSVYCFYVFRAQGENLITQLTAAVQSGDSNAVANRLLKNVVNFQYSNTNTSEMLEISASVRNTISAAFLLFLIMAWVYFSAIPRHQKLWWHSLALAIITIGTPTLLIVIMSRSSLISVGLAGVISFTLYCVSHRGGVSNTAATLAMTFLLAGAGLALYLFVRGEKNDFLALNVQRMNEISKDTRIEHYQGIFRLILRRPLLGYGLGAETPDGLAVHNFFLGAWFRAGIVGLSFSVLFYIALIGRWIHDCLWLTQSSGNIKNLPSSFLIPALMVEPLTRAPLFGGQDGRYIRVEWMAIACFLTILHEVQIRHEKKVVVHVD